MSENINWQLPENLNNLLTKTPAELAQIYHQDKDSLRRTKQKYIKRIEGDSSSEVTSNAVDTYLTKEVRLRLHKDLDSILDNATFNPDNIKGFRINSGKYQQASKHPETGEVTVTELHKNGVQIIADAKDFKPKFPVVHPAEFTIKPFTVKTDNKKQLKKAVVITDTQIGYWKLFSGGLEPFHDLSAMSIVVQAIADIQPDIIVHVGDIVDLPMYSRFFQEKAFQNTLQPTINFTARFFALLRNTAPNARIVAIEGNHDIRFQNKMQEHNMEAVGVRKPDDLSDFPIHSIPNFLNFEKSGVEYRDGYPASKFDLNDNLQIVHGDLVRAPGLSPRAYLDAYDMSTCFGHIHRQEELKETKNKANGKASYRWAGCFGTLCRIDGAVPSVKNGIDKDGRPLTRYENWHHGFGTIDYEEGDGEFSCNAIYINTGRGYRTIIEDKVYLPDPTIFDGMEND